MCATLRDRSDAVYRGYADFSLRSATVHQRHRKYDQFHRSLARVPSTDLIFHFETDEMLNELEHEFTSKMRDRISPTPLSSLITPQTLPPLRMPLTCETTPLQTGSTRLSLPVLWIHLSIGIANVEQIRCRS